MDMFPSSQFTPEGIAYYSFGEGKTSLVLVHGSFGNAKMWQRIIPKLVQMNFQVVALDLQGHGESKKFELAKTTMDNYKENITSVVNTLSGNVVLIGHSMSGLSVLMAAIESDRIHRVISIDPSPSKEIQGSGNTEEIPDMYTPMQAGMPSDPEKMPQAMPDVDPQVFPMLAQMLGPESGAARRQRKLGISITKEKLDSKQVLFMGAELGNSLAFGISAESTRKMALYYNKPYVEIPKASHPGMLIGKSSEEVVGEIVKWISKTS